MDASEVLSGDLSCYAPRMACCNIGAAGQTVMEYIETAVRSGRKLRDLESEVAFSRSAISRHMRLCIGKREAAKHREYKINWSNRRLVVEWPDRFTLLAEHDHRGKPIERPRHEQPVELTVEELRESDVLFTVSYEPPIQPRQEPLEEETIDDPETVAPAPLESHPQVVCKAQPPTEPTPCQHDMRPVSSGVRRCVHCGHQQTEFAPVGVSRNYHLQRSKYGRFG